MTEDYLKFRETTTYQSLPMGELVAEDEDMLFKYSCGNSLEIGTFLGRSAGILSSKSEKVYSFDVFEKYGAIGDIINREHYQLLFYQNPHSKEIVEKLVPPNVSLHYRETGCFDFLQKGSLDLIFLDGDHSYFGVKEDFSETNSFLKVGGHLLFHDSIGYWEGVRKFIGELPPNFKFIEIGGSTSVFQKLGI